MEGIDPNSNYNQVLSGRGPLDFLGNILQDAHHGMEQILMGGLKFGAALGGMLFGGLGTCGGCGGI